MLSGRRRVGAAVQNSTIYCGTSIEETPDAITAGLAIARTQDKRCAKASLAENYRIYIHLESTNTSAYLISWTLFKIRPTQIILPRTQWIKRGKCCFLANFHCQSRNYAASSAFVSASDWWSHRWHLPPLRTLLLQFLNESDKVEDDFLAFRGDDALRVELDTLKTVTVSSHYNTSPEFQGENLQQDSKGQRGHPMAWQNMLGNRSTWMCLYFLWRAAMISPSSVHAVASKASCGKVSSSMTKLWYLAAVKGLYMEAKGGVNSEGLLGSTINWIKQLALNSDRGFIII